MFKVPERYRAQLPKGLSGGRTSRPGDLNGFFLIPAPRGAEHVPLRCIASSGQDWAAAGMALPAWEHVSVSPQPPIKRTPTWGEMCMVKDLFWDEEDVVLQFHPPKSLYVNDSPYCLHLFRPVEVAFPMPPSICIGAVRSKDGGDMGRPGDRARVCLEHQGGCVLIDVPPHHFCTRTDCCKVAMDFRRG